MFGGYEPACGDAIKIDSLQGRDHCELTELGCFRPKSSCSKKDCGANRHSTIVLEATATDHLSSAIGKACLRSNVEMRQTQWFSDFDFRSQPLRRVILLARSLCKITAYKKETPPNSSEGNLLTKFQTTSSIELRFMEIVNSPAYDAALFESQSPLGLSADCDSASVDLDHALWIFKADSPNPRITRLSESTWVYFETIRRKGIYYLMLVPFTVEQNRITKNNLFFRTISNVMAA